MNDNIKTNRRPLNHPTDKSELNPAGSARRHLMRLLGVPGAAALTGIVATGWKKPIIESVILPAHAQTSDSPCIWGATLAIQGPASQLFSGILASILFDGVSTASFSTAGVSSMQVIGAGTHDPTDPHSYGLAFTHTGSSQPANVTLSVEASCCAGGTSGDVVILGIPPLSIDAALLMSTDGGTCTVEDGGITST